MCAFIHADRRNNNVIVKTNRVYEAYKLRPPEPQCSAATAAAAAVSRSVSLAVLFLWTCAATAAAAAALVVVVVVVEVVIGGAVITKLSFHKRHNTSAQHPFFSSSARLHASAPALAHPSQSGLFLLLRSSEATVQSRCGAMSTSFPSPSSH